MTMSSNAYDRAPYQYRTGQVEVTNFDPNSEEFVASIDWPTANTSKNLYSAAAVVAHLSPTNLNITFDRCVYGSHTSELSEIITPYLKRTLQDTALNIIKNNRLEVNPPQPFTFSTRTENWESKPYVDHDFHLVGSGPNVNTFAAVKKFAKIWLRIANLTPNWIQTPRSIYGSYSRAPGYTLIRPINIYEPIPGQLMCVSFMMKSLVGDLTTGNIYSIIHLWFNNVEINGRKSFPAYYQVEGIPFLVSNLQLRKHGLTVSPLGELSYTGSIGEESVFSHVYSLDQITYAPFNRELSFASLLLLSISKEVSSSGESTLVILDREEYPVSYLNIRVNESTNTSSVILPDWLGPKYRRIDFRVNVRNRRPGAVGSFAADLKEVSSMAEKIESSQAIQIKKLLAPRLLNPQLKVSGSARAQDYARPEFYKEIPLFHE